MLLPITNDLVRLGYLRRLHTTDKHLRELYQQSRKVSKVLSVSPSELNTNISFYPTSRRSIEHRINQQMFDKSKPKRRWVP